MIAQFVAEVTQKRQSRCADCTGVLTSSRMQP